MNRKTAGFLIVTCTASVLAGGHAVMRLMQPGTVQEGKRTESEQLAESSVLKTPSVDVTVTDASDNTGNTKEDKETSIQVDNVYVEKVQAETEPVKADPEQKQSEVKEADKAEEPEKTQMGEAAARKRTVRISRRTEPGTGETPALDDFKPDEAPQENSGGQQTEESKQDPAEKNTEENRENDHSSAGHIQKTEALADHPPGDTVGFVPSRKEEIMENRYVESVVNENDPDTYQIVKKEKVIPTLYVNHAGDIKYAYEDGVWYEYKYSNGNITLDVKDKELALLILNLDGSYDGYEAVSVDCVEAVKEGGGTEYEFHVRYQGIFAMEASPSEVAHLTAGDIGRVAAARTVTTEEKMPVMMQQYVGTGEYRYYGWQILDGDTFYFDQEGNKVTGPQVIQGIRHEFDENGVRTSRAGVEVSEDSGEIDWEKVSGAGLDFVVIRCACRDAGTGRIVPDSRAEENIKGAREAGLEVVLSVFSQAVTREEAIEEAETAISMAKTYGLTTPIVITSAGAAPEHTGRADGLKPSERTACVYAFCQTIKEYGYTPMLHAEAGWMEDSLCMETLSDTPLWVAEYNTDLTYTRPCDLWQYTAKGTVEGISGYTGLIISYENRRDYQ